jgi:hypothetical protein
MALLEERQNIVAALVPAGQVAALFLFPCSSGKRKGHRFVCNILKQMRKFRNQVKSMKKTVPKVASLRICRFCKGEFDRTKMSQEYCKTRIWIFHWRKPQSWSAVLL